MGWDGKRPASGTPAGGEGKGRRDLQPGHVSVMVSGYRSRRVYEPLAAVIVEEIVEAYPELGRYPFAVARFARAEARSALLARALAERGILDEDGEPREALIRAARAFDKDAALFGERLGLDPVSETEVAVKTAAARKLTSSTARDLQELEARGRELIAADGRHDVAGEIIAELRATTPPGPRSDPDRPPRKRGQGSRARAKACREAEEQARAEAAAESPWVARPAVVPITAEAVVIGIRDAQDQADIRAAFEAEEDDEADDD